jgi:hypothetical protein
MIMLLVALTLSSPASACDVRLELSPVSSTASSSGTLLDARLVNVGSTFCVMYPHWEPTDRGATVLPRGWLALKVSDETGHELQKRPLPKSQHYEGRLREPAARDFLILQPGHMWGIRLDLASPPWGYKFVRPGEYTVTASLVIGGQDWLKARGLEKEADPPAAHFIQGNFHAVPVTLVVKRLAVLGSGGGSPLLYFLDASGLVQPTPSRQQDTGDNIRCPALGEIEPGADHLARLRRHSRPVRHFH